MHKRKKGYTLIELIMSISVWMILSLGVLFLWQHTTNRAVDIFEEQEAFERGRVAMDILVMNLQMARSIELITEPGEDNHVMRRLILNQRNPNGDLRDYTYEFSRNPTATWFQMLIIIDNNVANEMVRGIGSISMVYVPGQRIDITVETACDEPIVLHGSVDVRYKNVVVR